MAPTGCEEQLDAVAVKGKEEDTEALLPGLVTFTPLVFADEEAPTLIATSLTQEAPPLPQALTCNVCVPVLAETVASMEVP